MTEKQGGLKRRVNLKIGKSLEIQEIVRTKGKKWEKTAVKTGRKGQPGRRISLGSPKPRLRMERITRFTVCLLKNIWGFRQSDWGFAVLLPMCFTGVFAFILLMPLGFVSYL